MNNNKTLFRKCAYCPHHSEQVKCCCKKTTRSTQNVKKSKSKPHPLINQSSIQYPKETQINFSQIDLSNLLAQNSMLKCQNSNLKNDLLSLSHCIQDQRLTNNKQYISVPTVHTLNNDPQSVLSDRLYVSNKNLQEAIMQVDILSRKNKELSDQNSILSSELSSLSLENQELKEQIGSLRKLIKRAQQGSDEMEKKTLRQNYKLLRQKYENMKIQNSGLNEQIDNLRYQIEQIDNLRYQISKKSTLPSQNMSPEWIAQTSNKLSFIEQKIDCAQNRFKSSELERYPKNMQNQGLNEGRQNSTYFEMMHQIKKEIALSINTIHSKTRKFNSVFDTVGNVDNMNVKNLICSLIEGFVESCMTLNTHIERQLNRKINVLEKRLQNLLGKLQNFVLQFKNRQLRKRSTSRSRILLTNKSGLQSRSPSALNSNKENTNINIIDRQY